MSTLLFAAYPSTAPKGAPLGILTEATDKSVTVESDGIGSGSLSISTLSPQAAWCADGNYVAAWRDTMTGPPCAGFWIDAPAQVVWSRDEQGGRILSATGKGPIDCLQKAIVWHRNFRGGNGHIQRRRGRWLWRGGIQLVRPLIRQLEEAKARGSIPFVTWSFNRNVDSAGVPWPSETRVRRVELPIGISLLEVVSIVRTFGLHVEMDASFRVHAWPEYQRDLSGTIAFEGAVDIAGDVTRTTKASRMRSNALVGGERRRGGERFRPVANSNIRAQLGWRQEGFRDVGRTASLPALRRVGQRSLRRWKSLNDGPLSLPVLESPGKVALKDYIPGDTVHLFVPGAYDGPERIAAITVADIENGEADPLVEFRSLMPDPESGRDWGDDAATSAGA